MLLSDFDYELPKSLIAQHPPENRTDSRLLHLDSKHNRHDLRFVDIVGLLAPSDLLVLNNTRVIKASFTATRQSGGHLQLLFERMCAKVQNSESASKSGANILDSNSEQFLVQIKHAKRLREGEVLQLQDNYAMRLLRRHDAFWLAEFVVPDVKQEFEISRSSTVKRDFVADILAYLLHYGEVPLPPYIRRVENKGDKQIDMQLDERRYQTVYASNAGAVAAPTAGLHFNNALLEKIRSIGVQIAEITLHVGSGTFAPVRVEDVRQHVMHQEYVEVAPQIVEQIKQTKSCGGRVVAVGTTSVRALEQAAISGGLSSFCGMTSLFICPGFDLKVVDCLVTNFHLPKSTLLMLVSAFSSKKNILQAYAHAISKHYRFFSYGDAMFIER